MSVILLLIVAGGFVAGGFLVAFAWAVRSGQYDDVATPAVRMLFDGADRTPAAPSAPSSSRCSSPTQRGRSDGI
jgi:cbb3-type cytochrome oxidase maturation protein